MTRFSTSLNRISVTRLSRVVGDEQIRFAVDVRLSPESLFHLVSGLRRLVELGLYVIF